MLELLDAPALDAARPHAGWDIPAAGAALLVETDGATETQARDDLLRLGAVVADSGGDVIVAGSEKERERMRRSRRLVSSSLKETYPYKVSDDIAVPRSHMPALLEEAASQAALAGLAASAYGHLGDGNLHVNLLCKTAEERRRAQPVREHLWRFAVGRGGTISGEHGIGLTKREALALEQGPGLLALQRRLKAAFDPAGLCNPGKVWPQGSAP
jgi:glycolate oxidase